MGSMFLPMFYYSYPGEATVLILNTLLWLICLCSEYNFQRISVRKREETKKLIYKFVREKPQIITLYKVWPKNLLKKTNPLMEKESLFKYNYWIDDTDLVNIESNIYSCNTLLIGFKVVFADVETQNAYKDHVERRLKLIRESLDFEDVEAATKIENHIILDFYSIRKDTMDFEEHRLSSFSIYDWHWSLKILGLIYNSLIYNSQRITIKKIVSKQCKEITYQN